MDNHLDFDIVLQALSIVVKRFPSVKLIVTGKQDNSLTEQAKVFGLENHLHITGFLPYEELPWYLGCADLFVLPFPNKIYNVGRWPAKIGDYMSLGRPTVSNPVGDVKSLFENYEIGLLADADPRDYAEKIIFLLDHPNIAHRLGENARNLAMTTYDWKIITQRLEEFYYKLLDTI